MRSVDARAVGPHLRYTAGEKMLEQAMGVLRQGLAGEKFVLYGSGDFHYLSAWWLRAALLETPEKRDLTLLAFDNHPDWDVRPPRWGCGGWINRALDMENVARASVWGCGNFELQFPARLFRNKKTLASGRLQVHGWAERQSASVATRFSCMTRENWRERFAAYAQSLRGAAIYVTVDFDTLAAEHAVTNWENGLFLPDDIAWAIGELRRAGAEILAGDCCGAFSPPQYARRWQRFIANFDHPKQSPPTPDAARAVNHRSLAIIWPALLGASAQPIDTPAAIPRRP
jgi:hypothetical protein